MKPVNVITSFVLSWDLSCAVVVAIVIACVVPARISGSVAKEIFSLTSPILSVTFSVFFAALAVLVTSGENEFVQFLEEEGAYTHIVWTFKVTLFSLFLSLVASIILFLVVLPYDVEQLSGRYYPGWIVVGFAFLASYALFASMNSAMDAIKYAEYRARFVEIMGGDTQRDP